MSGWEQFTWISAWVLALGSIIVFIVFLWQLPDMLRRARGENEDETTD